MYEETAMPILVPQANQTTRVTNTDHTETQQQYTTPCPIHGMWGGRMICCMPTLTKNNQESKFYLRSL